MKITLPVFAAVLAILSARLHASPLKSATVSRIVNEVKVVESPGKHHRAAEREILKEDSGLRVGAQSRVEIVFADRTLARVGAETSLTFKSGTRDLSLDRGTLLLQIPNFRGGARIRTGALVVACGGATILVEHLPGKSLKAVVLAGTMRVSIPRFLGDSIVVPAGRMLITSPDVERIPDPVDTDLRTLVSTSALIHSGPSNSAGFAPLPSLPQIMREITRQEDALMGKRLIRTNLVIRGSGTNVVIPGAVDATDVTAAAGNGGSASASQNREHGPRRTAEKAAPLAAAHPAVIEPTLPEP